MATYTVPSGDRIWAGRDVVMPDPNDVSFTWPPGATCSIPLVEGVGSPIHPKVLDFGAQWNGYRYWMAFTPYPGSQGALENPSVVASNDGAAWVELTANPIVPAPSGAGADIYNSDTHLCFVNGVMYLVWREFNATVPISEGRERVRFKTSADGREWSNEIPLLFTDSAPSIVLSPTLEFFRGEWWLWTGSRVADPLGVDLRKSASLGDVQTAVPQRCVLSLPDNVFEPWHFDVTRVPNGWVMLISDRHRTTYASGRLWLAFSGDGLDWKVGAAPFSTEAPSTYRSSIVKNPDNSGFECWITDFGNRRIRPLTLTMGL